MRSITLLLVKRRASFCSITVRGSSIYLSIKRDTLGLLIAITLFFSYRRGRRAYFSSLSDDRVPNARPFRTSSYSSTELVSNSNSKFGSHLYLLTFKNRIAPLSTPSPLIISNLNSKSAPLLLVRKTPYRSSSLCDWSSQSAKRPPLPHLENRLIIA